MERYKKNEALQVNYLALKKTTGLIDVTMKVYNPSDVLVSTFTMVEVVAGSGEDALGLYRKSFTPTIEGQWRIRIESATNGDDISKVFEVGNYKLDDLQSQLVTIDGKVDNLDADVVAVKGVVDGIVVDVAAVKGVADSTETKVDAVKAVVDAIDLQINAGGYIL